MATKKLLVNGAYYTAFAERKKIRGVIYDNGWDFHLLNNQGVGDSYADSYDDCDFSHGLHIERDTNWDEKSHNWVEESDEQALKACKSLIMEGNEKFLEEDWEREALKDEMFIGEYRSQKEQEFWEWYNRTEGNVKVEQPDRTLKEVEPTLDKYFLPF